MKHEYQLCSDYFDIELMRQVRPLNTSLIDRRDVFTILDPKSHTTPVPINLSLRFCIAALYIFMFSMHHDFV